MKLTIFSLAFLLICLSSCTSPKASNFRAAILQKERVAFNIILGKNGSEAKKLKCLVDNDFKGALAAVDQQTVEFDQLLKDIDTLKTDGLKAGEGLKHAAVNYYAALKALHIFDRKEILQREAIVQLKGEDLRSAQDELLELARQKQALYEKVYQLEGVLHQATEKFNAVHPV